MMILKLCSGGTTHLESYCALQLDNQTDKDKRLKIILRGITNLAVVNDIHFDLTKNEMRPEDHFNLVRFVLEGNAQ